MGIHDNHRQDTHHPPPEGRTPNKSDESEKTFEKSEFEVMSQTPDQLKRAVQRELSSLIDKQQELEEELQRIGRQINEIKSAHNINALWRRDMEDEFYDWPKGAKKNTNRMVITYSTGHVYT